MFKEKLKKIFSKIGLKLLVPYLIFSFFVLILIFVFVYYSYLSEIGFIKDSQQKMAEKVSKEIDSFVSSTIDDLKFFSKNITCLDCEDFNGFLAKNLFSVNPDIYSVHIFDQQGEMISYLHRYSKKDHLDNWGGGAIEDDKLLNVFNDVFISSVYISAYDLPFVSIGVPILNEVNTQIGSAVIELDLSFLWDVISKNKFKKTGYVYVVDVEQEPKLIAYKDVSFVKSKYDISNIVGVQNLASYKHSFSPYKSFDDKRVVGVWDSIKSTDWGLLVELPIKEIFNDLLILLVISIFSVLLFFFFIIVILASVYRNLLTPLKELTAGVNQIGLGNLKHIVTVKTKDEIEDLAKAFNAMTSDLRISHNKLKDYSLNLEKKVKDRTSSLLAERKKIKESNKRLAESEQKFRSYIDRAPDGVFVIDNKASFVEINNSAFLLTAYSKEELSKMKFFGIICEKDVSKMKKHIENVIKLGQAEDDVLYKIKGQEDCDRYFNISSVKLGNGLILVFAKDITKEKEVDKAKTEFVSLASHQLRTPLAAINWYSEMLLAGDGGKLTEDQEVFAKEIYGSNKRMVELVNSLLNVSRLEMGTFVVEPQPTNIIELMKDVISEQMPMIKEKKIEIKENFSSDLPIINLDPKLLRIVFQNLVSNAVKYTSDNKNVYIDILLDKKKKSVYIKVQDEGYGIQKNQQDKIFGKLFRADNVKKRNTEGTGLGLYIVKEIVAVTGGEIWFESEENKGTTFHLSLPLKGMKAKKGEKGLS